MNLATVASTNQAAVDGTIRVMCNVRPNVMSRNLARRVIHRPCDQHGHSRKHCHLRIYHIQMFPVTRVNTKRDKWDCMQFLPNLFGIHK